MSDIDAVLFANEAFYQAFSERDIDAMDELWALDVPVVCLHPGWPPLDGREQVMQSWVSIMANPDSPQVSCHDPQAHVLGDAAYVICYEKIEGQFLVATNMFARQQGRAGRIWRLVHHHSGPTSGKPSAAPKPTDPIN